PVPRAASPDAVPDPARAPVLAVEAEPEPAAPALASAGDVDSEFERARELYRKARFDQAAAALGELLRRHPAFARAEEAQFLLGESWYGKGSFPQAIVEYGVLVERWPQGDHAAEALYKTALSYY